MSHKIRRADYPLWVKFGMLGVPGRAGLWAFVGISIACAIACFTYGCWDTSYFLGMLFCGGLFLVSALMYWLTIRWVDQNGSWHGDSEQASE